MLVEGLKRLSMFDPLIVCTVASDDCDELQVEFASRMGVTSTLGAISSCAFFQTDE